MTTLSFGGTKVTREGVKGLTAFKRLVELKLPRHIADEGVAELAPLRGLTWLDLGGTAVTDEGIAKLNGLIGEGRITALRCVAAPSRSRTSAES